MQKIKHISIPAWMEKRGCYIPNIINAYVAWPIEVFYSTYPLVNPCDCCWLAEGGPCITATMGGYPQDEWLCQTCCDEINGGMI